MASVEALSSSVVREYLFRKGLKATLEALDNEMPRIDGSISNRPQLAKQLRIKSLMKKNKETKENFRTMLEVIVQYLLTCSQLNFTDTQSSIETLSSSSEQSSQILSPSFRGKESRIEKRNFLKETERSPRKTFLESELLKPERNLERNELNIKEKSVLSRDDDDTLKKNVGLLSSFPLSDQDRTSKTRQRSTSRDDLVPNKITGISDNEWDLEKPASRTRTSRDIVKTETQKSIFGEKSHSKDHVTKTRNQGFLNKEDPIEQTFPITNSDLVGNEAVQSPVDSPLLKKTGTKTPRRSSASPSGAVMSTGLVSSRKNERVRHFRESFEEDFDRQHEGHVGSQTVSVSKKNEERNALISHHRSSTLAKEKDGNEVAEWTKGIIQSNPTKKPDFITHSSPVNTKKVSEELIFEDVDDNLTDELDHLEKLDISRKPAICSAQNRPITLTIAKDLKTILFGSTSATFNQEWRNQGFSYSDNEHLKYGIIQHKGGPCGLLASVQAVILKHLLFGENLMHSSSKKNLRFSLKETRNALCSALTEILWRAGSCKEAFVTVAPRDRTIRTAKMVKETPLTYKVFYIDKIMTTRSERAQFLSSGGYKFDGLTEKLLIYGFYDEKELESFIRDNMIQFSSDQESGSVLLLYSVILSRSIEKIKKDMDDPNGTLMGAHGYCTQDMVNLILNGKAVSNTFNDIIELDGGGHTKNILKGIEKQSDIGLLSLFEYYKSCLVGSYYKNPKFPIWVVCSESHFSVLFSLKRSVLNERRIQKTFDLYYYDGLARQDEEIRLTVDITAEESISPTEDLIPPLELCIRTKWKDAVVDWNGTEPLL